MTVDSSPVKFTLALPGQPVSEIATISGGRPVLRAELPDARIVWLVSGYENVRQMLVDRRFSRALAVAPGQARQGFEMFAAGSINGIDPPGHTRLRKLVASAFTARRVEALRPRVTGIVGELIDAMAGRPQPMDLVAGFLAAAAGPGDLRDARRARRGHPAVPCLVRHHHRRLAARSRRDHDRPGRVVRLLRRSDRDQAGPARR